jgi:hypothetical protein
MGRAPPAASFAPKVNVSPRVKRRGVMHLCDANAANQEEGIVALRLALLRSQEEKHGQFIV